MSKDEREFLDALRHRSIEAAAEMLAGVQKLKAMYEELTDDGTGIPRPRLRLGDHLFQLAKVELEHASTLAKLGNTQAELVFDHLRQLARRHQKASAIVLEVRPVPGVDQCVGELQVRNPFDESAHLRFERSATLRSPDGSETSHAFRVEAAGRASSVPASGSVRIVVTVEGTHDTPLFGDLEVFVSAKLERSVAKRLIKVVPPG